jgi:FMN phosphatase YigB (HAD superfamily)
MSKSKLLVDFDGTLTIADSSIGSFKKSFEEEFVRATGINPARLHRLLETATRRILEDPSKGWERNGVVVAPATADPYVLNTITHQDVCDGLGISRTERDKLLDICFRKAYSGNSVEFREGIERFLEDVQGRYDVAVITNSTTGRVQRELGEIGFSHIPVFGDAQKYTINHENDEVPESVDLPDFPRPVMLRRENYLNILRNIGFPPKDTTVLGDIYEMDLALPDYLGMNLMQFAGERALLYEVSYMQDHPRGSIVKTLQEAQEILV